jgi:hypothetical protein
MDYCNLLWRQATADSYKQKAKQQKWWEMQTGESVCVPEGEVMEGQVGKWAS